MPKELRKLLEDGAKMTIDEYTGADGQIKRLESFENEIRDTIPVVRQLLDADRTVKKAYLCDPRVTHVFKMVDEGGFCGYRNIQMMVSYIQNTKHHGHELFPGRIPSILELQDKIEQAWDAGYGAHNRTTTGGIRGTRKYIGTPEVRTV